MGGLGEPLAENLVRSSCQNLVICDFDLSDESNWNKQICTIKDIGKRKIDVMEEFLRKSDPGVYINNYFKTSEGNIDSVLKLILFVKLLVIASVMIIKS